MLQTLVVTNHALHIVHHFLDLHPGEPAALISGIRYGEVVIIEVEMRQRRIVNQVSTQVGDTLEEQPT